MTDGCNDRRSRTGPGQFFVFARILRASLRLRGGPADLAGFVRILRVSWGSARLYQLGVRGYKNAFAYSGLWDLYKALPQDNVVSCKPKHNM